MSTSVDLWYVRFPDGRVLGATSTAVLRQHLEAGRIPLGSSVRRSPGEEWVALETLADFADLAANHPLREARWTGPNGGGWTNAVPPAPVTVASRLDPARFQSVAIRGLLQEALAALDLTLVPKKLLLAGVAGLFLGLGCALAGLVGPNAGADLSWLRWWLAAAGLLVLSAASGLLTRLTFVELSRLRPARWYEGLDRLPGLVGSLVVVQGLVLGGVLALVALLRWLPPWLLAQDFGARWAGARDLTAGVAVLVGTVLEAGLWIVSVFALLLAPILVVEGCSIGAGLLRWLRLLRQYYGRLFLYEVLALVLGMVMTLPLAGLLLALPAAAPDERLRLPAALAWDLLAGLLLSPGAAYLVVANVFIYLNLRYPTTPRQ